MRFTLRARAFFHFQRSEKLFGVDNDSGPFWGWRFNFPTNLSHAMVHTHIYNCSFPQTLSFTPHTQTLRTLVYIKSTLFSLHMHACVSNCAPAVPLHLVLQRHMGSGQWGLLSSRLRMSSSAAFHSKARLWRSSMAYTRWDWTCRHVDMQTCRHTDTPPWIQILTSAVEVLVQVVQV